MRRAFFIVVFAVAVGSTASVAQRVAPNIDDALAKIGVKSTRGIDSDICYPANALEYQELGKNGILMLKSQTAIATELPLRSAFLMVKGVRVPLQRIVVLNTYEQQGKSVQVSFYLIPLKYMKSGADLKADFTGERSAFGVMTFAAGGKGLDIPDFAKLDEYDDPHDADLDVAAKVIAREFANAASGATG